MKKIVLITGATSGIGRDFADIFAREHVCKHGKKSHQRRRQLII